MKLLFLFFFLLIFSFLTFPPSSLAKCYPPDYIGTCGLGVICSTGGCCDTPPECPTPFPIPTAAPAAGSSTSPLCDNGIGVNTAIGCLKAGDPKQLVSQLLGWGVGLGGGIAFLLIVYAGFQIATAAGDPKRVQAARELLVSAISGLILIVLSVVLLNLIGVKILALPGFTL